MQPQNNQPDPSANRKQSIYENLMLAFGIGALISMLANQGFLLKICAAVFLGIAVINIVKNSKDMPQQPAAYVPTVMAQPEPSKKRGAMKTIGLAVLVLAAVPVVIFGGFFLLIMIMLASGGGDMGS